MIVRATVFAPCLVVTACLTMGCGGDVELPICCGTGEPLPTFQYVESYACADLLAYTWSEPRSEYFVVESDLRQLRIELGSTRTFEIASAGKDLNVHVNVYEGHANPYCSDIVTGGKPTVWHATSGTVTIARSIPPASDGFVSPSMYRVVITATNLVFEGPARRKLRAAGPITISGNGGWSPYG
jgi:hypothetical protein